MNVVHYFDYKSPYAYLAQAANDELEKRFSIRIERIPYTLHIPSYLGDAELDAEGRDTVGTRNAHQWRRVRYSYMDCRREANRLGVTIRGPKKIWDSKPAHVGFLYAAAQDKFAAYHALVYARFWQREFALDSYEEVGSALHSTGVDTADFARYMAADGPALLARHQAEAESAGVFGVPSWLVNGELFWGAERLVRVEELLARGARAT